MPIATKTPLPDLFDFTQGWTGHALKTQRLQAVLMDAARRLASVRIEAGAEACTEAFGHMATAIPSPGLAWVEWPVRMMSAQTRAWRMQQAQLDIWAHAIKATADVFAEKGVYQGRTDTPVSNRMSTGHFIERRVSAEVISFAERRKLQPIGVPAKG